MPYTGRPRGSGGPLPMIAVGVVFGAVGVAVMNQPFARSIALPFLALGVVLVLAGVAWAGYRLQRQRQGGPNAPLGPWAGGFGSTLPGRGSTTVRTVTVDPRGQDQQPSGPPQPAAGQPQPVGGGLRPGRATVMNAREVGAGDAGQPLYDLELMVEPMSQPPYRLRTRYSVPQLYVSRVSIGASLPVQIDPAHTNRIAVEWNQP